MQVYTPKEIIDGLRRLPTKMPGPLTQKMKQAVMGIEGVAKINCTVGKSPYWKAPYTDDNDPRRKPPHMRDVMYSTVQVEGKMIKGFVGNPKEYSTWVHQGTSRMPPRPFIEDAIKERSEKTQKLLSEGINMAILQSFEGNVWGEGSPMNTGYVPPEAVEEE